MKIKDWDQFQHFKDRNPIWVKLYRTLLDDIEWHKLSGDDAKALVMLWLLASEKNGELPEVKEIAFRLRLPETKTKQIVTNLTEFSIDISALTFLNRLSDFFFVLARILPTAFNNGSAIGSLHTARKWLS